MRRLRASAEWQFLFGAIWRADRRVAALWWSFVLLRAALPAGFTVAMGILVDAIQDGDSLTAPLLLVGILFTALQTLAPVHDEIGYNLGATTMAWLQDRLLSATVHPLGIAHLEHPDLINDLTLAQDIELNITSSPLPTDMTFIGSGLASFGGGITSAIVLAGYEWWAALLILLAWLAPHVLLRESTAWRNWRSDEVKDHQRHADYAYRVAVDPPAAKELRMFGLGAWAVRGFAHRRRRLLDLSLEAMRLRERSVIWTFLIIAAANVVVFWSLANSDTGVGGLVVYAGVAIGVSAVASLDFDWWLQSAARPVPIVLGLEERMGTIGSLSDGTTPAAGLPHHEIRFRDVGFAYAPGETPVLNGLNLTIPAGSSLAIVGKNGAGKTTLIKLLCRLYDPGEGSIHVDGSNLRDLDLNEWRRRVTAVFQDFVRYEKPLRDNVAPAGAPDEAIRRALRQAGADGLAELDTILSRAYDGGTDLSGGQWQRIALARALCAVQLGAGVVILDEPTAQLDVRGETEIFDRILAATKDVTTILISHRFSTVRHADQICVLEHGRVIELGSHDELMARGGRYRTMFQLQAERFTSV